MSDNRLHPLTPLSASEQKKIVSIVREQKSLDNKCYFSSVELKEPSKAEIKRWEKGANLPRCANIAILNRRTHQSFEGVVDLCQQKVISWRRLPFDKAPWGQFPLMIEDILIARELVLKHPKWREAVKRRGMKEEEIDRMQIDPWTFGAFEEDKHLFGRRLIRAVGYLSENKTDNGYAHPIEGLHAIVDLDNKKIVEVRDDHCDIPVPRKKHNYDPDSLGTPRSDLKPLHIIQPEGVSFKVDGWKVSWQNWEFRLGFTAREGLVLHQIKIHDGEKLRSLIHRASVTDMAVPYSSNALSHYWKCAFDGSEYGLGVMANSLELGCDCLGAVYNFDASMVSEYGDIYTVKNAICIHEEDHGVLWKHHKELRRSRRLVISFFATVGNYDYGFFWHLYQDGSLQLETKLTGIIQTAALRPEDPTPKNAGRVTSELYGPTHQHFFGARLHMDIDGVGNSVVETEYLPLEMGELNQHGNVFATNTTRFTTELEACRRANGNTGRYWKIINPNGKNAAGNPPGYKLMAEHNPVLLSHPDSTLGHRAGFALNHLWVTPWAENEAYCSGKYTNQHLGDGLPIYVKQNRCIDNQDIVVWHTYGHTHTCKPEDFPIMPMEHTGFWLRPNNFFDGNPAMDLPNVHDNHSVDVDGNESGHEHH